MEHEAIVSTNPTRVPRFVLAGGAWLFSYFLARHGMQAWTPVSHWDIAVMSIPVVAFFWFAWEAQLVLRHIDELHRRIHLEALALAFLTVLLALMGIGLLEETPNGRIDLPVRDIWFALLPLYGICYLAARRHYR